MLEHLLTSERDPCARALVAAATVGLLLAAVACLLLATPQPVALADAPRQALTYTPYLVPPKTPTPKTAAIRKLLKGSSVGAKGGWIVVHLAGTPYQIGFQNGYLTAQSAYFFMQIDLGPTGSADRKASEATAARYVWPKIPAAYRQELQGITDGVKAAGYPKVTLWDVVAANDWADEPAYSQLSGNSVSKAATRSRATKRRALRKGGCSAFIATGRATADGRPVMGHNTWSPYDENFMYNVMFYVHPQKGYRFSYQSAGGQIWSGQDWYVNSAGLMLAETTLADSTYSPKGTPIFVRARAAAQYDKTVAQAVATLRTGNNGAYSSEWLVGDSTGQIASLQLGNKAYDLNTTRDGFFGSSNFDWGKHTRAEEGSNADPWDASNEDYARYVRWTQLRKAHSGQIDFSVGQTMLGDTWDTYLGRTSPDSRTICGEPEHGSRGVAYSGDTADGAYDGKVTTEDMVLHGMQVQARWGHPNGDGFDAARFLAANRSWAADNGTLAVFGLRTFSAQTPNPWVSTNY